MRRKNNQNKISKLYYLPFILVFLLGILQIYLSNRLATYGKKLKNYQKEIALLEEENRQLKSQTAAFGNLNQLAQIAEEKGFVKDPQVINYRTRVPVALNP